MPVDSQLKPQVYLDPRPAAEFQALHRWARGHDPDWVYTLVRALSLLYVRLVFRLQASGLELIPARRGVGRLALHTGAPVIPVAIHGSEHVRNWRWLQSPPVHVAYGEPLCFGPEPDPPPERQQEVADEVLRAVRQLYGQFDQTVASSREPETPTGHLAGR